MADLIIRIAGDMKKFDDALDAVEKRTESLSTNLSGIALGAGAAFAGLTAEIGLAVHAFAESQAATRTLTQAMQNAGVFSERLRDNYTKQAAALQELTGVDDDAIVSAQAQLQARIGQKEITKELTTAILDLAEGRKIDLASAADYIAKGINGQTAALQKLGIEVDKSADAGTRQKQIIDEVSRAYGGQAAEANKGLGALRGLRSAFADIQEELGMRFAPSIEKSLVVLTKFLRETKDDKGMLDLIANGIKVGTILTGLITVGATAGAAFVKLRGYWQAAALAAEGLGAAASGGLTVVLSALIFAVYEFVTDWDGSMKKLAGSWAGFCAQFFALAKGVEDVFNGLMQLVTGGGGSQLEKGLAQMSKALFDQTVFTEAYYKRIKEMDAEQAKGRESQDKKKADAAAASAEKERAQLARTNALERATEQLRLAEAQGASTKFIALKKAELEQLKLLADENFKGDRAAVGARAAELRAFEATQASNDFAQKAAFHQQVLDQNAEFQAMTKEQQDLFLEQNRAALEEQALTGTTAQAAAAKESLQKQIEHNNAYLLNHQKFGKAYAELDKAVNSERVTAARGLFGQLAAMQESSNDVLKTIGKAGAITSITIDTARSVVSAYRGAIEAFGPIFGPIIGGTASAALIAFGAEQIGKVTAARDGGLITGGVPGRDSVPAMLSPGELVVPERSYEEVVSSVASRREGGSSSSSGGGVAHVILELKGELMDFIEAQLVERERLGLSIQGA